MSFDYDRTLNNILHAMDDTLYSAARLCHARRTHLDDKYRDSDTCDYSLQSPHKNSDEHGAVTTCVPEFAMRRHHWLSCHSRLSLMATLILMWISLKAISHRTQPTIITQNFIEAVRSLASSPLLISLGIVIFSTGMLYSAK